MKKDLQHQVFDIQKFSLHDGPGIRTTVFLKGCPLRCAWCSNPEGLDSSPTLSHQISKCTNCLACVDTCPTEALTSIDGILKVQHDKCNGCGDCLEVCPSGALKLYGYEASPHDIIQKVKKDKLYFEKSGGGITLSGGEVMMQPEYTLEILKLAKEEKIHTCIETCGFTNQKDFATILPYVDIVLFDYKITDPNAHRLYTGRSNELIRANLKFLSDGGVAIVLRVPIIPGINDNDLHFKAIAELSKQHTGIERVEVMPYHNWGMHKYLETGRKIPNIDIETPSPEMTNRWVAKLKAAGCKNVLKS